MITQWLEIADTGMMTTNTDTDADYRYNYNTIAEQLIGCKCSNSSQKLTHTNRGFEHRPAFEFWMIKI